MVPGQLFPVPVPIPSLPESSVSLLLPKKAVIRSQSNYHPCSHEELREAGFHVTSLPSCQLPWPHTILPPGLTGGSYCSSSPGCLEAPSAARELCKIGFFLSV